MQLSTLITSNEKILYEAKPAKSVTILESVFNQLLPIAILWGAFDGFVFGLSLSADGDKSSLVYLIPFLLFHMMPVWIYLGGILTSVSRYKNTNYMITTKGVYVSKGVFSFQYEMKSFAEMSHISIHRGIIDNILGTGDVIISCNHIGHNQNVNVSSSGYNICNIKDYERIFRLVKQLQEDVYTDTMFPNQYRPQQNPGYQTSYANPMIDSFLVDLDDDRPVNHSMSSYPSANGNTMNSNPLANDNSNPFENGFVCDTFTS